MIIIYSTFGISTIFAPSIFLSLLAGISFPFLLATKLWNWRHPYREISVLNDTKSLASYFAFGATIVTISIALKHLGIDPYQMLLVKPGVPPDPYQMLLIGPLVALALTILIGPFFYWVLGLDSRTKHRRFSTELPRCDSCHIERHRCGEAISSAFVESTVNHVVSKRMVTKQHMRWSPTGAQLFLQVRTQVLNNDLAAHFKRWYPGFTHHSGPVELTA